MNTQELADLIRSEMEDEETPKRLLEALKKYEGKKIQKRVQDKLKAELPDFDLKMRYVASMTQIEWGGYGASGGNQGGSFLIGYDSEVIDTAWIEQKNPAYLSACQQRNADRRAILDNPALLQTVADCINKVNEAKKVVEETTKELDRIAGIGPIRWTIRNATK